MAEIPHIGDVPGPAEVAGKVSNIQTHLYEIYGAIVLCVLLWLVYKFMRYRVLVRKLQLTQGGYVCTVGRYRLVTDKDTRRPSLEPAFGGDKLPAYDSVYFQKLHGMPFVGCKRVLTLVFLNPFSPVVCDSGGRLIHVDIKRWMYDSQRSAFIKKFQRGNVGYFLTIYAPLVVIVGAIAFWIYVMFLQMGVTEDFAAQLEVLVKRLGY